MDSHVFRKLYPFGKEWNMSVAKIPALAATRQFDLVIYRIDCHVRRFRRTAVNRWCKYAYFFWSAVLLAGFFNRGVLFFKMEPSSGCADHFLYDDPFSINRNYHSTWPWNLEYLV